LTVSTKKLFSCFEYEQNKVKFEQRNEKKKKGFRLTESHIQTSPISNLEKFFSASLIHYYWPGTALGIKLGVVKKLAV
jgi:hypothetical protein